MWSLEQTITASYDTINADAIIDFMTTIKSQYPTAKKIHLILDQAGTHRAQSIVKQAKKLYIKLHFERDDTLLGQE